MGQVVLRLRPCGRVCGVHVVNTGFSAGAIIIGHDDMPPTEDAKTLELERLRKEIEELKKSKEQPMEQCNLGTQDIINLIREAISKEMIVLRKEIEISMDSDDDDDDDAEGFEQKKKGRNKKYRKVGVRKGGGRNKNKNKKGPVWSEEDYKELVDKGIPTEKLREMADEIREQIEEQRQRDMEARIFEDEDYNPYPEYDDTEIDPKEIEDEWFKQRFTKTSKHSKFSQLWYDEFVPPSPKIRPEHVAVKFNTMIDPELKDKLSERARKIKKEIEALIGYAVDCTRWREEIDTSLVLDKLCELYYDLNEDLYVNGMPVFFQSKNSNGAQKKNLGPKSTKSMAGK